jgi:hypothetical protein
MWRGEDSVRRKCKCKCHCCDQYSGTVEQGQPSAIGPTAGRTCTVGRHSWRSSSCCEEYSQWAHRVRRQQAELLLPNPSCDCHGAPSWNNRGWTVWPAGRVSRRERSLEQLDSVLEVRAVPRSDSQTLLAAISSSDSKTPTERGTSEGRASMMIQRKMTT